MRDRDLDELIRTMADFERFREAIDIFRKMSTSPHFETFLTLPAYRKIV